MGSAGKKSDYFLSRIMPAESLEGQGLISFGQTISLLSLSDQPRRRWFWYSRFALLSLKYTWDSQTVFVYRLFSNWVALYPLYLESFPQLLFFPIPRCSASVTGWPYVPPTPRKQRVRLEIYGPDYRPRLLHRLWPHRGRLPQIGKPQPQH